MGMLKNLVTLAQMLCGIGYVVLSCMIYWKIGSFESDQISQITKYALIALFVEGILLALTAFFTLSQNRIENQCFLLICFIIFGVSFLMNLAILGGGITAKIYIPKLIKDKECKEFQFFEDLQKLNEVSYETLCQSSCQCKYIGKYDKALEQGIYNYTVSTIKVIKVQQCEVYKQAKTEEKRLQKYSGLLSMLEDVFKCSGFCSKNKYFVFSDVNRGVPNEDCKKVWLDYLDGKEVWIIILATITSISFLISICYIGKHDRQEKERRIYVQ